MLKLVRIPKDFTKQIIVLMKYYPQLVLYFHLLVLTSCCVKDSTFRCKVNWDNLAVLLNQKGVLRQECLGQRVRLIVIKSEVLNKLELLTCFSSCMV